MSSFYGGRPGHSFSIVAVFSSKQAMINEFKKGSDSIVHFDEYVAIIDDSSHPEENGNIYRRGYNYTNNTGGAELIGNLLSGVHSWGDVQDFSALDASLLRELEVALLQTQGFENRISALEESQGSSEELEAALEQIQGFENRISALEESQGSSEDIVTFDSTPTQNSTNPVTSGGIYSALADKVDAEPNKGLISDSERTKLSGITAGATATSVTQTLSSGTKIGTVTVNGVGTDLYCEANTDTTYSAGTGISISNGEISNSAPNVQADWNASGTAAEILNKPTIPNYSAATQSAAGLMSAADKEKLDKMVDISDRVEAIEENPSGLDTVQTQIEGIDSRLAAVEESNSEAVTGPLATLSGRVDSIETTLEGVTFSNGTVALNDLNICSRYIANVDNTYSEKSRLISNVNDIGTFYATQNVTENGQTTLRWTDLPAKSMNFIVTNAQYSLNWMLQTAVSTTSPGIVYNRLIPSAAGLARNYEAKNWACVSYFHYAKKVLVIGDSISYGWRTNYVGYVGLLGLPYQNESVAGATLSTNRTDVTNIPAQLDGVTDYAPNIIIANGGINDYIRSAPLGTVPTQPVTSSTVSSLDLSTVTGGLQKLFYLMITKYPTAHRYFIITHKTFNNSAYYVTTQNSAGYTQQDLHDAIAAVCLVYNVEVIDVYEKGFVNSFFEEYRASVHYVSGGDSSTNWEAAKSNTTDYVDGDGIHPLIRGYQECYVPLIREAIKSAM